MDIVLISYKINYKIKKIEPKCSIFHPQDIITRTSLLIFCIFLHLHTFINVFVHLYITKMHKHLQFIYKKLNVQSLLKKN